MSISIKEETEHIFSLLAYALVHIDWQSDSVPRNLRRGYNVGALIVNPENQPVFFDYNCINSTINATQHGEVRAITKYIDKAQCFNLSNHSLYVTLEPCAMCAGMITMTNVEKVVYGQRDIMFSGAFDRLAIDSQSIGGLPPYPRIVETVASTLSFCVELDAEYQNFCQQNEHKILARFLASNVAKEIFRKATQLFLNYQVTWSENVNVYQSALDFYKKPILM